MGGGAGGFLPKQLLLSKAWKTMLSRRGGGSAALVYGEILRRRVYQRAGDRNGRSVCVNNGEIRLPYSDAEKYWGFSPKRFRAALDMLEEFGFIDVPRRGSGMHGDPSLYAESNRWERWDTQYFKQVKRRKRRIGWAVRNKRRRKGQLPSGEAGQLPSKEAGDERQTSLGGS